MKQYKLTKITPINGFDGTNQDNAMQNNYAWSMAEFNGYLYVGTGRNIPYTAIAGLGLDVPPELTPQNPTNDAEIWRYPLSGKNKRWERVYKAPPGGDIMGFRYMITYTPLGGVLTLYCATFGLTETALLQTTDGDNFTAVGAGIPAGFSTRSMAVYDGKLYTGATNALDFSQDAYLFVTENPEQGWQQVDFGPGKIPTGEVVSMISFNGFLYIGTSPAGGFEVWKSSNPEKGGSWKLIVDKGAGDALNEVPMSMEVFKGYLYVGSGIWIGVQSVDPDKLFVPPKGFDVIRIAKNDTWKLVVGSKPIAETFPSTGTRNLARVPSGFGNLFNAYCWQIRTYHGRLFIGSWDSAILWHSIIRNMIRCGAKSNEEPDDRCFTADNIQKLFSRLPVQFESEYNMKRWMRALITSLKKYPQEFGFDLWESGDGENFEAITLDGFCNRYNYGLRTMVVSSNDRLFLGTANPYQGCEVWQLRARRDDPCMDWCKCCCCCK